ncbi:MAG: hypothetical protein K8R36_09925 [Planctomycetales bacterium]|nr:hypothetical protein [Planctomycetales bacterium]
MPDWKIGGTKLLKRINNKTVQGDSFRITVPDIRPVVYTEGSREARVEIEGGMVSSNVDWLIYAETLSGWHITTRLEPMSHDERELVLHRISEALHVLDMPHKAG